ncbi:MAG: hypothetical protein ACI8QF_003237, partial [Limisphaerales bacterium]
QLWTLQAGLAGSQPAVLSGSHIQATGFASGI